MLSSVAINLNMTHKMCLSATLPTQAINDIAVVILKQHVLTCIRH